MDKAIRQMILTLALASAAPAIQAAPAGWYVFKSKTTGAEACMQTAPSSHWSAIRGPYRDAGCQISKNRR